MNLKIFFLLLIILPSPLYSQKNIKEKKVYRNDLLYSHKYYDKENNLNKIDWFNNKGNLYSTTLINDSLTLIISYRGDSIHSTLKYYNDLYGNTTSIVNFSSSLNDSIFFVLEYKDSLLLKSTCKYGCDYYEKYIYDSLDQLVNINRINTKNPDWNTTTTIKYNEKGKESEKIISSLNSPRVDQKILHYYFENKIKKEIYNFNKEESIWLLKEKIITSYDEKDDLLEQEINTYYSNSPNKNIYKYTYELIYR